MLQIRGYPLNPVRTAFLVGAAAFATSAVSEDFSLEALKRIGEQCRSTPDFQACIDRALESSQRPSPVPPVRVDPPLGPMKLEPHPTTSNRSTPLELSPEETRAEFCRAALRYRDGDLRAIWKVALERSRKGKIYEEAYADLHKMRNEIEQTIEAADAAQTSLIVLQVVKLNADLIMDLLKFDPTLARNPVARIVFDVYGRHQTIDDQVHREFEKHIPAWVSQSLEQTYPKVKLGLDAVVHYAENVVRLGRSVQEPRLRQELEQRLAHVDRMLAQYAKEIREGPVAVRAVLQVRAAIKQACTLAPPVRLRLP